MTHSPDNTARPRSGSVDKRPPRVDIDAPEVGRSHELHVVGKRSHMPMSGRRTSGLADHRVRPLDVIQAADPSRKVGLIHLGQLERQDVADARSVR